jgi:hypothetical protein
MRKVSITFIILLMLAAAKSADSGVERGPEGKWIWRGPAGWQRLMLDLRIEGKSIVGSVVMGPGVNSERVTAREDFWELYFDPAVFPIINGRTDGRTLSFEHTVIFDGLSDPRPIAVRVDHERFRYTGTVQDDVMTLTREYTASPANRWTYGTHRVEISLTRMK